MAGKKGSTEFCLEDRKEIERLICLGCSYEKIAETINRSVGGIKNEVLKNGGRDGYNAEVSQQNASIKKKKKTERLVKQIQEEDCALIEHYASIGFSIRKISVICGISRERVESHLRSAIIPKSNATGSIEERISALEFQIEIIIETIRKIHDSSFKN